MRPLPADKGIGLYQALLEARRLQLHPALNATVSAVGVARLNQELERLVPADALDHVASLGLRGERVFPVPALIEHAPPLIGYYRMLLGLSWLKDFTNKYGYGAWAKAERDGVLSARLRPHLDDFCVRLIEPLVLLVKSMGQFDDRDLNDLALLTLGPTLQGQRNNVIGREAAVRVFRVIRELLDESWITFDVENTQLRFVLPNHQAYEIVAATDPDIRLNRGIGSAAEPVLAIEIKGGGDFANAHNRAGEAEKSQIKAQQEGYQHRWTMIQMGTLPRATFDTETPTSTAIFEFTEVVQQTGPDWLRFRKLFLELIGVDT
ncbi:MAG: XcyI family restriction endonuclease [Chloroflexota bacterium]|nr:XcyI family restriction endonuclease [Chloroflexota bacterium]MDQ5867943.1 XcyI family restriction endonuclease [Chloroflexota bacterium]